MGELFNAVFTYPITNLLVGFYQLLIALHVPFALGFAIIVLTATAKLALSPLMSAQIKSTAKMQKLAPQIAKLKEKHKDDKQKQQAETMKLYSANGINPASGCLPMLIQFPILISLYRVLTSVVSQSGQSITTINKHLYFPFLRLNTAWDPSFFGIPLFTSPAKLMSHMPLILLVPITTAVLQFVLSKMMMPLPSAATAGDKPKKSEDFQSALQMQSMFIFPLMIAYFSFSLPFGLSLYWNTFTIFGILQQYYLVGAGGMSPWFAKIGLHGRSS